MVKKETKKIIRGAKSRVYENLYRKLVIKDREKKIFKISCEGVQNKTRKLTHLT